MKNAALLTHALSLTALFPEINRKYSRFEVTNIYLGIRFCAVKTLLVEPGLSPSEGPAPPASIGRTEAPSPMARDQRNLMKAGYRLQ